MKLFEKTLTSETKFEGRIIKVLRDTWSWKTAKRVQERLCATTAACAWRR